MMLTAHPVNAIKCQNSFSNIKSGYHTDDDVFKREEQIPSVNIDQSDFNCSNESNDSLSFDSDRGNYINDSNQSESASKDCVIVPTSLNNMKKVVQLIEYYLSDENLVKDMFLLKHVTKHREGYISLKLLTNYKKVKRFTKDSNSVAIALKSSTELEISEDLTKVRRKQPLPAELEAETWAFRTIFAYNIPQDLANIEKLSEIFSSFGEMNALRVIKPEGKELYQIRKNRPDVTYSHCAVIEYEKVHFARQALKIISNSAEFDFDITEFQRNIPGKYVNYKIGKDIESCYYSASEIDEPLSPLIHRKQSSLRISNSSLTSSGYNSPNTSDNIHPSSNLEKFRCSSPVSPNHSNKHSPLSPRTYKHRGMHINYPYNILDDQSSSAESYTPYQYKFLSSSPYSTSSSITSLDNAVRSDSSGNIFASNDLYYFNRGGKNKFPCCTPPSTPLMQHQRPMIVKPRSAPSSPWICRRRKDETTPLFEKALAMPDSSSAHSKRVGYNYSQNNIIRLPRGPDGSRGFSKTSKICS